MKWINNLLCGALLSMGLTQASDIEKSPEENRILSFARKPIKPNSILLQEHTLREVTKHLKIKDLYSLSLASKELYSSTILSPTLKRYYFFSNFIESRKHLYRVLIPDTASRLLNFIEKETTYPQYEKLFSLLPGSIPRHINGMSHADWKTLNQHFFTRLQGGPGADPHIKSMSDSELLNRLTLISTHNELLFNSKHHAILKQSKDLGNYLLDLPIENINKALPFFYNKTPYTKNKILTLISQGAHNWKIQKACFWNSRREEAYNDNLAILINFLILGSYFETFDLNITRFYPVQTLALGFSACVLTPTTRDYIIEPLYKDGLMATLKNVGNGIKGKVTGWVLDHILRF